MKIDHPIWVEKSMMSTGDCSDPRYVQVGLYMILLGYSSMLVTGGFLRGIVSIQMVIQTGSKTNNVPVSFREQLVLVAPPIRHEQDKLQSPFSEPCKQDRR